MNQKGSTLYVNHDSFVPSGRVKVIHVHVRHLVRNGYPACLVHNKAHLTRPWLNVRPPTLHFDHDLAAFSNDRVVIPQNHNTALQASKDIPAKNPFSVKTTSISLTCYKITRRVASEK